MPIDVEANLKIPSLTIRSTTHEPDARIDNRFVRFTKVIQVPAIPQPGASLLLQIGAGETLECTVTRADWHEARERFILSCTYSKKSISADLYTALIHDTNWTVKQL